MKNLKKIVAVVLALLTVLSLGVCSLSASAATAPAFELKIASQSGKNVTVQLVLASGEFNSLDVTFKTSANISSVKSILTTDAFDSYVKELKKAGGQFGESSSASTKKISLASTAAISKKIALYDIVLVKKSTADLVASDITATITECIVGDTSVKKNVKVTNSFGKFDLDKTELALNYKSSAKLNATGTKTVKWSSSNTNVATVDANGNVTATGRGSAVITADNGSAKATCNVNVNYTWWQWIIVIVLFGWIWY